MWCIHSLLYSYPLHQTNNVFFPLSREGDGEPGGADGSGGSVWRQQCVRHPEGHGHLRPSGPPRALHRPHHRYSSSLDIITAVWHLHCICFIKVWTTFLVVCYNVEVNVLNISTWRWRYGSFYCVKLIWHAALVTSFKPSLLTKHRNSLQNMFYFIKLQVNKSIYFVSILNCDLLNGQKRGHL